MHNRQYFEKVAGWRITMPVLPDGGTRHAGRWWSYYPSGTQTLTAESGPRGLLEPIELLRQEPTVGGTGGTATLTMTFNAIGNRELLKVPERMQIQCSRRMSEAEITQLRDDVLEVSS